MVDSSKEGLINGNNLNNRIQNFEKKTNFEPIPELKSEISGCDDIGKINNTEHKNNKSLIKCVLNDKPYINSENIQKKTLFRTKTLQDYENKLIKFKTNNEISKKNHFSICMDQVRYSIQENNNFNSQINHRVSADFSPVTKKKFKRSTIFLGNSYIKKLTKIWTMGLNNSALITHKKSNLDLKLIQTKIKTKTDLFENIYEKYQLGLYEELKNNIYYQRSERFLTKIKILYIFLAIFSLLSILFEYLDNREYISRSWKYLTSNKNFNKRNINDYFIITKRKISSKENTIRIFNIIFSIFCLFLFLSIQSLKYQLIKKRKKKKPKKNDYNDNFDEIISPTKRKKTISNNYSTNNNKKFSTEENVISLSKLTNENKIELIIKCFINIIFLPPFVNKVFIGKYYNTIYVYSINSIFLIITNLKLLNVYRAFLFLSPLNNMFTKVICRSNLINLNYKFILKFSLKHYPITFILVNFIILVLAFSSMIYSLEYFSISSKYVDFDYSENNSFNNFLNCFDTLVSLSFKQMFYSMGKNTFFGFFILMIGGVFCMHLTTYFFYYLHRLIEIKPEEQKAYSKLIKLFNPENKEHKASNLIRIFILIKKLYNDNSFLFNENNKNKKKIEKIKNEPNIENKTFSAMTKSFFIQKQIEEDIKEEKNKRKKNLIKFYENKFILKMKFANETRNFDDKLKVARNFLLSFNDVLKTVKDKLKINLKTLNIQLDVAINQIIKFNSFINFEENTKKKLKKVAKYQKTLNSYLLSQYENNLIENQKEREKKIVKVVKKIRSKLVNS